MGSKGFYTVKRYAKWHLRLRRIAHSCRRRHLDSPSDAHRACQPAGRQRAREFPPARLRPENPAYAPATWRRLQATKKADGRQRLRT